MQYVTRPDASHQYLKSARVKALASCVPAILLFLAFDYIKGSTLFADFERTLLVLTTLVLVLGAAFYLAESKARRVFQSYTLIFDEQLITREQHGSPTVSMLRSDVTNITKDQKGAFTITGRSKREVILVPAQITDYNKLLSLLNSIRPVSAVFKPLFTAEDIVLVTVFLGSLALIEMTYNKLLLVMGGVLILFCFGYVMRATHQNPNIDQNTKNRKWVILLLAIPLAYNIYEKLV